jgi:polycystin 1L2
MRTKRLIEVKMNQIIREISIYTLFLFILYVVAFGNLSSSSFNYNQLYISTFARTTGSDDIGLDGVKKQNFSCLRIIKILFFFFSILKKIKTIDDFWSWTLNKLSPGLRANSWYNGSQPYGLAGYLNDFSSRMVGYATLKQLRVKNGSF